MAEPGRPSSAALIDHLVLSTPDLGAAREELAALGFVTSPFQAHPRFGTGNHLVVLDNIYIELLGIVDPDPPDPAFLALVEPSIAVGGALAFVAVTAHDPQGYADALQASGHATDEVKTWSRPAYTPSGEFTASFTTFTFAPTMLPGAMTFFCKQHTPELIYQKEWQRHANSVRSLDFLRCRNERAGAEASAIRLGPHTVSWDSAGEPGWTIGLVAGKDAARTIELETVAGVTLEFVGNDQADTKT